MNLYYLVFNKRFKNTLSRHYVTYLRYVFVIIYINLHLKTTKLLNEIEIKMYLYFRIGSYLVTFHKCNILCVFNNQI